MTAPHIGLLVLVFAAGVLTRSVWDAVARWRRARRSKGEWEGGGGLADLFENLAADERIRAETDELREYLARHHAVTERQEGDR